MSISHARHFGMNHRPVCTRCRGLMNVTRRSPHPLYGNAYELQTFECRTCGHGIERSCDGKGLRTRVKPLELHNETIETKPRPCTKCRAAMILARIERAKPGFDLRTFECLKCNNADQYLVEYGTAAPWLLRVRGQPDGAEA
jgi:hypothetical protein